MNIVSPFAHIYGDVTIGENVRIDDFVILTGKIMIGNNIHIGAYSFFSGGEGIILEDYVQIAPRVTILTHSDDYSGRSMIGPTIPDKFKSKLERGRIVLKRHVVLGINTVIMPGVTMAEGSATGALTFVKNDTEPWTIYTGIPARYWKPRETYILQLEKEFEKEREDK